MARGLNTCGASVIVVLLLGAVCRWRTGCVLGWVLGLLCVLLATAACSCVSCGGLAELSAPAGLSAPFSVRLRPWELLSVAEPLGAETARKSGAGDDRSSSDSNRLRPDPSHV